MSKLNIFGLGSSKARLCHDLILESSFFLLKRNTMTRVERTSSKTWMAFANGRCRIFPSLTALLTCLDEGDL